VNFQNAMRRAEASFMPLLSRIEATIEETAVVTNIVAIKAAIAVRVICIISSSSLALRR